MDARTGAHGRKMGDYESDNSRLTPHLFIVEVDGIQTMRFQKCEGLEAETEVFEYQEGGGEVHKFKGRSRFPNIVLEKGIVDSDDLWKWYKKTAEGNVERQSGSIVLCNLQGEEIKRWNFFRAFPCRWIGPALNVMDRRTFAVERVEIAHEWLEVDGGDEEEENLTSNNEKKKNANKQKIELPPYDGKTTYGVLILDDGKQYSFNSGKPDPIYRNYIPASHVEGKAAIYMRENKIQSGTVYHNNTDGTCPYCDKMLPTLLEKDSTLKVVPPQNATSSKKGWITNEKIYIGNDKIPKTAR